MADEQRRLMTLLERLETQLRTTPSLDPAAERQITEIVNDLKATLQNEEKSSSDEQSPADRLREAARQFELSHPTLSHTIGSAVDVLAQMGI